MKVKNLHEQVKLIGGADRCRQLLGLAPGQCGHFQTKRDRDPANTIHTRISTLISLYLWNHPEVTTRTVTKQKDWQAFRDFTLNLGPLDKFRLLEAQQAQKPPGEYVQCYGESQVALEYLMDCGRRQHEKEGFGRYFSSRDLRSV